MTRSADYLLEVDDLELRGGRRTLVRGLSMQVGRGEVWGILGANGTGKTTFMESVVGLRAPERGSIRIAGKTLEEWTTQELARMRAFLPQKIRDSFRASALELVLLGRHPHMNRWAWEGDFEQNIARSALMEVGMADTAQRDVTTLSGGERQRVAIAALIAQDAPLLILDEPVAHVDLHHQHLILERLREMATKGSRAVLMSLHDANLAVQYATHVVIFHGNGRVDCGRAADILNEEALSMALKCRITRVDVGGRVMFLAA